MSDQGMWYGTFLTRVIEDGVAAARADYANDPPKLKGAVAGFEACRGQTPTKLGALLLQARREAGLRFGERDEAAYWEARTFEAEVEWVCNVVSSALLNQGAEVIVPPTVRGMMRAAEILGVAGVPRG